MLAVRAKSTGDQHGRHLTCARVSSAAAQKEGGDGPQELHDVLSRPDSDHSTDTVRQLSLRPQSNVRWAERGVHSAGCVFLSYDSTDTPLSARSRDVIPVGVAF